MNQNAYENLSKQLINREFSDDSLSNKQVILISKQNNSYDQISDLSESILQMFVIAWYIADNEYLKPVSETQSSQEDKTKKLKYGNKKHLKTLDDDVYQQKNSLLKYMYNDWYIYLDKVRNQLTAHRKKSNLKEFQA